MVPVCPSWTKGLYRGSSPLPMDANGCHRPPQDVRTPPPLSNIDRPIMGGEPFGAFPGLLASDPPDVRSSRPHKPASHAIEASSRLSIESWSSAAKAAALELDCLMQPYCLAGRMAQLCKESVRHDVRLNIARLTLCSLTFSSVHLEDAFVVESHIYHDIHIHVHI